ncbi:MULTISPECIES: hypothetical protein [Methylomonas]|uniref:hypothetical protein n=1 Tax=Methylomonas TaxID=416 RepID=UPI00104D8A76|nr:MULTISPECIES: hypothetical protein [Methylomonas]
MDYHHLPVTDFIRGPLLTTPQGWVVVGFSVIYLGIGLLTLFVEFPATLDLSADKTSAVCMLWPFLLFVYFIRDSGLSNFSPSLENTIWLVFWGMAPISFWLYDHWHIIFS